MNHTQSVTFGTEVIVGNDGPEIRLIDFSYNGQ